MQQIARHLPSSARYAVPDVRMMALWPAAARDPGCRGLLLSPLGDIDWGIGDQLDVGNIEGHWLHYNVKKAKRYQCNSAGN